jgi:hypothetical protein
MRDYQIVGNEVLFLSIRKHHKQSEWHCTVKKLAVLESRFYPKLLWLGVLWKEFGKRVWINR